MKTRKIIAFALLGAVAGLLVAEFLPSLGRNGLSKAGADLGFALGARKPYLPDAAAGAALGALLGWLLGGKR